MKKALVTGGGGFIGSNVVRGLLHDGVEVAVLDNFSSGYRANLDGLDVRLVEGDVLDGGAVGDAMAGCDAVFHLAASVGNARSLSHPFADSEINVLGTLTVLETARRHGVRKVVYSSSAGIFGELKQLPIREDHPLEPDTPYGCSKLAGEKLCLSYARLYGMANVCLRYFNVYGRLQRYDAYGNVIPIFAHQMLRSETVTIFGDGEQTRDFVNVDDVAQANIRAARAHGVAGAFNVGSGTCISINELVKLMEAAAGVLANVRHAGPRPGDVRDSLADISAARAAIGFAPAVTLEDGLAHFMSWAREALTAAP